MIDRPSEQPARRMPSDEDLIRLDRDYEVAYWATVLGVSTAQLRTAVEKVGLVLGALKRELTSQRR
jgi:Protein of unknown function (DUF3606)